MHLTRTLAIKYPQRIFGAMTAARVLGFECPWSNAEMEHVQIATEEAISKRRQGTCERIYVHPLTYVVHNGIRVTSPERTLVDCGLRYPYAKALGIFDSALRSGMVNAKDVEKTCAGLHKDCSPVRKLLRDADEKSENGGESFCRAVILDAGFARPELQHEYHDPANPKRTFRTDFLWKYERKAIVLEYDGMEKYTNKHMTNGHETRQIVYEKRRREDALRRAGVTTILRTDYEEVRQPRSLIQKLLNSGVPMALDLR